MSCQKGIMRMHASRNMQCLKLMLRSTGLERPNFAVPPLPNLEWVWYRFKYGLKDRPRESMFKISLNRFSNYASAHAWKRVSAVCGFFLYNRISIFTYSLSGFSPGPQVTVLVVILTPKSQIPLRYPASEPARARLRAASDLLASWTA